MKTHEPNLDDDPFSSICPPEEEIDWRPPILRDVEAAGFDLAAVTSAINTSWPTWVERLAFNEHSYMYGLESCDNEFLNTIRQRGKASSQDLARLDEVYRRAMSNLAMNDTNIGFSLTTSPPEEEWRPPILRDLDAA